MVNSKCVNGKWLLLLLIAAALSSCRFGNQEFANFLSEEVEPVEGSQFIPTRVQYTEVDQAFPTSTPLPTEADLQASATTDSAACGPARTTSFGAAAILQNLLSWGYQKSLTEISGIYMSITGDGDPLMLSGKVIMPADGHFRRYVLVSHYTICSNAEAPYYCFSLEGILAKMGYAVIIPDYLGYGLTADSIHPYLMMDQTAIHVADMYFAVNNYMKARGFRPTYDDIYLMGYSQGGATTMAVLRYIEEFLEDARDIHVRRAFVGGGPYDVKATYERFITTDEASYPVAVPLVLQGMIRGAKLNITCQEMMAPRIYENLDFWINSKQFTSGQINLAIGTRVTHKLLSPKSLDPTSSEVAELYQAMTRNSIISYAWTPRTPIYMMHSIDDETVPYENATRAKSKWANANIRYNFGHYGGHVMTCLRFINTVQQLLDEEQKEEDL